MCVYIISLTPMENLETIYYIISFNVSTFLPNYICQIGILKNAKHRDTNKLNWKAVALV